MLPREERNNLLNWSYNVEDNSITSEYLSPLFQQLASYIPSTILPNMITIAGLACLYQAYISQNVYFGALLLIIYYIADCIDGIHARRTNHTSPMGELMDHICDNIGLILVMNLLCDVLDINPVMPIMSSLLLFMNEHIKATIKGGLVFGRYSGPGELVIIAIFVLLTSNYWSWMSDIQFYIFAPLLLWITYIVYQQSIKAKIAVGMWLYLAPRVILSLWNIGNMIDYLMMVMLTADIIQMKMTKKKGFTVTIFGALGSILLSGVGFMTFVVYIGSLFNEISFVVNKPLFIHESIDISLNKQMHMDFRKLDEFDNLKKVCQQPVSKETLLESAH